jgi:hypothetical protein
VLGYAVERALYPVNPLESLSQPGLYFGTEHNVDRRGSRSEGGSRGREQLYRHIEVR